MLLQQAPPFIYISREKNVIKVGKMPFCWRAKHGVGPVLTAQPRFPEKFNHPDNLNGDYNHDRSNGDY